MATHGYPGHGSPCMTLRTQDYPMGTHGYSGVPLGTHGLTVKAMGTQWIPWGTHGNPWVPVSMGIHRAQGTPLTTWVPILCIHSHQYINHGECVYPRGTDVHSGVPLGAHGYPGTPIGYPWVSMGTQWNAWGPIMVIHGCPCITHGTHCYPMHCYPMGAHTRAGAFLGTHG